MQRGQDPVQDRKDEEREKSESGFASCARDFVEQYAKQHQRTWHKMQRLVDKFLIPAWGDRPVREIRRRDVVDLFDKIAAKLPYQANQVLARVSRLFNWPIEREAVEVNPDVGFNQCIKPEARSRIFTDTELAALWRTTVNIGGTFGAAVRMLMVTGVRRDEAARLRWDELQDKEWADMPASPMEGKRDVKAPLSTAAQEIIEAQPRLADCEYVFTNYGRNPISGWSQCKAKLDASIAADLGAPVPDWRLHDLRRTLASGLARLGNSSEVIKRVLGHAAHSNDVTAVHYNWHNYDAEALASVQAWADHLATLITPKVSAPSSESTAG